MCAHYIYIPQDELESIIADLQAALNAKRSGVAASYPHAYPKAEVPVLVPEAGRLGIHVMRWGFSVTWRKDVLFNAKMETALGSKPSMWDESVRRRRCVVPSFGFYEPHKTAKHPSPKTGKPISDQYFFHMPDSDIVFMAGVFENERFSIMTTAPNQWMKDIHPRMPVVLHPDEADTWLSGDYAALADRSALRLDSVKVTA